MKKSVKNLSCCCLSNSYNAIRTNYVVDGILQKYRFDGIV